MTKYELADEFIGIDGDEDRLTKAVFGCFELLSTPVLTEVFQHADVNVSFRSRPKFVFHETINRREPDVVLTDGHKTTLMVESKLKAPTDRNQLEDEYADLIGEYSTETRRLVHVTDDTRPPRKLDRVDIPMDDLVWTSWRAFAAAVRQVDDDTLNATDKRVLVMLKQILDENGFQPFGGFTLMTDTPSLEDQLEQAYDVRNTYYEEINSFRKDVESQLAGDLEFWRFFRRGVSGGMGNGLNQFPNKEFERMPKHIWFSYTVGGEPPDSRGSNYLKNYLTLDFNSKSGALRAGYVVTTNGENFSLFREAIHQHQDTVLEILSESEFEAFTTSYSLSTRQGPAEKDISEFLQRIENFGYDESDWGKRFMIARKWPAASLPTRDASDEGFLPIEAPRTAAETLNEIHKLTYTEYPEIFYPNQD